MSADLKARSHGIFSHDDALATCSRGETVCGVYQGSAAYECLNTDTALDSCKCHPSVLVFYLFKFLNTRYRWRVHVTKSFPFHVGAGP